MLNLVKSLPKSAKVGKNTAKPGAQRRSTGLLLTSVEFTAALSANGRGGQLATARPVPGHGWCLLVGTGPAQLGAKRGGLRTFKTLDALVATASRLGCDVVFLEVPRAASRLVDDGGQP